MGGGGGVVTPKKKAGQTSFQNRFSQCPFCQSIPPTCWGNYSGADEKQTKRYYVRGGEIPLGKEKENQNKLTYCRKTNSPPFPSSPILLDEKNEKKTPSRDFIYIFVRNNLKIIAALGFFRPCATLPPRFGWMPISHWPH